MKCQGAKVSDRPSAPASVPPSPAASQLWWRIAIGLAIAGIGLFVGGTYLIGYPVDLDVLGLGSGMCAIVLMVVGGLCGTSALAAAGIRLSAARSRIARALGSVAFLAAVAVFGLTCIVGVFLGGFASDDIWHDLGTSVDGRHLVVQEAGFTHPYAQFADVHGITVTRSSTPYFLPDDADPLGGNVRLAGPSGARVLRWSGDHGGIPVAP